MPYVGINGEFADGVPAPVFSTDDALAAELAVDHLHRLGHRRIGMASGPSGNRPADRRVRGFVAAMARRGIDDAERWVVRQSYSVEGGQSAATSLVGLGATGIVAASDFMALGAVRGIRRLGLSVPGDVSVVGYDGSTVTEFTDPALTTVRQPADRLALEVGPRRAGPGQQPGGPHGRAPVRPGAGDQGLHGARPRVTPDGAGGPRARAPFARPVRWCGNGNAMSPPPHQ
ncbi:substrate-binding domain-containing protein [Streptomyces showdoensis]|uniref:substrate-binding domain-containing protein n=1 Tax=Streptomyces showdoensis TaxID=68268 RepID=UPI0031EA6B1B